MSFGTQLRLARKRKGLTQKDLADAVGARHNTVSNWEAGRNQPDPDTVRALCALLEVDSNYFYETEAVESQLSRKYGLTERYIRTILQEEGLRKSS